MNMNFDCIIRMAKSGFVFFENRQCTYEVLVTTQYAYDRVITVQVLTSINVSWHSLLRDYVCVYFL